MNNFPKENQQFIRNLALNAAQGDVGAFQELYQQTRQRAWFVALSITKNEHDAQDILQESYLKAYQSLSQLKQPELFESWLGQIVANKAKNYISRTKPDSFADYGDENAANWQEETDPDFLPGDSLDQAEAKALIAKLVSDLPEDQRLVVLLRYYDDMDVAAIAAALDLPEGTVKSRLSRARRKLAAMLQQAHDKGIQLYSLAPVPLLAYFIKLIGFEDDPGDRLPALIGVVAAGAASAAAGTAAAAGAAASSASTATGAAGGAGASSFLVKGIAIAAATAVTATGASAAGVIAYRRANPPEPPAIIETSTHPVREIGLTTITSAPDGHEQESEPVTLTVNLPAMTMTINRTARQAAARTQNERPATFADTSATQEHTFDTTAAAADTQPVTTTVQTTTQAATTARAPFTTRSTTQRTTTASMTEPLLSLPTVVTSTTPVTTTAAPTTTTETTTTEITTATESTTLRPDRERFQFNPSNHSIMRYTGDETDVTIPSRIDGVAVLHIMPNAFAGMAVRRVVISEGIDCIQSRAFADCIYLEEIVVPNSVILINANAFSGSDNVVFVVNEASFAHSFAVRHRIPVRLID